MEMTLKATMYGAEANTNTSWRYEKFIKAYESKCYGKLLQFNLKGTDEIALSPCEDEIDLHIKSASFVANMD